MVGTLAELMVKTQPKTMKANIVLDKREISIICTIAKGSVWDDEECITILQEAGSGFEINPCNSCIGSKMVNETQMTIRWHVDDLMISLLNEEGIMQVVHQIKDIYGENLKESVGTVHNHLGMTIDYLFSKEVQINMWDDI